MASVTLLLTKPPMAKLSPSRSCTVVEARRVVIEGNRLLWSPNPLTVVPTCDSSETSGVTRRLIRPSSSTVGKKRRPTPNSFSSNVMVVLPVELVWGTGMKILPPARNEPSWPLTAVMVGSASTLTRPFFISAVSVMMLRPLARVAVMAVAPSLKNCDSKLTEVLPMARVRFMSTPSSSSKLLETSATLTSNMTCCAPCTRSMLMTFLPPLKASVSAIRRCTFMPSLTRPLSTRLSFTVSTRRFSVLGTYSRSFACRASVSVPTEMSRKLVLPCAVQTSKLVCPVFLPSR